MNPILLLVLVLSGGAGLIYQVTWVRLLGLSLGSTSAAVATVVSAFFLGLALGSYAVERLGVAQQKAVRRYVAVEAAIGLFGLLSLPLFLNLDQLLSHAPALGDTLALKFALSVVLLIVPTTLMGATFPLVALIAIRQAEKMGNQISQLYGYNTAGGVAGALLSGFVLIPRLGLDGAIMVAAGCNMAAALLALGIPLFGRSQEQTVETAAPAQAELPSFTASGSAARVAAVTLMATGFGSIAAQVGWTKYLAIFTGSTVYGFSAILGIFLIGIALGSLAVKGRADRMKSPEASLAVMILLLAASMLVTRWGLGFLPRLQELLNAAQEATLFDAMVRYVAVAVVVLPPTLLLGAIFPLNLKLYCAGSGGVSRIGRAYALNTLAGILGALAAGFLVIPYLGTDTLLVGIVLLTSVLAAVWVLVISSRALKLALVSAAAAVVALSLSTPGLDFRRLIATVGYDSNSQDGEEAEYFFLEEGKAGVISMVGFGNDMIRLQNNGLNESGINLDDKTVSPRVEFLLGMTPYLLNQDPHDALVIGFGGGHTARALTLTEISAIDVVELEPAVIRANLAIDSFAREVLDDKRVKLTINDARNQLLLSGKTYDLIVSQPSHPWVAGASALFTREFWGMARARLKPDGIFAQWVNLFSMEPDVLRSLLATFYAEFDHGFVLVDRANGDLLAIGSAAPVMIDPARFNRILSSPKVSAVGENAGITSVHDVLKYFAFSRERALEASQGAVINTDTNLFSEVNLALGYRASDVTDSVSGFIKANRRFEAASFLAKGHANLPVELVRHYLAQDDTAGASYVAASLEKGQDRETDYAIYQSLFAAGDAEAALALFSDRKDWGDTWLAEHIGNMVTLGMAASVRDDAVLIEDAQLRSEVEDKLLFATGHTAELAGTIMHGSPRSVWQALALADVDLDRAYAWLRTHGDIPREARIDGLIVEMRYNALKNRRGALAQNAQALVTAIREETERLEQIRSRIAGSQSDEVLTAALDERIARLASYSRRTQ